LQITKDEKENQSKVVEGEVRAAVAKVTASYEERLSSSRAEHNLKIQQGKFIIISVYANEQTFCFWWQHHRGLIF
jgi:hypothetical protein